MEPVKGHGKTRREMPQRIASGQMRELVREHDVTPLGAPPERRRGQEHHGAPYAPRHGGADAASHQQPSGTP